MKKATLLYNARIVNENRSYQGYVQISPDGIIKAVAEGICPPDLIAEYADNALNLNGHLLLPGVIDSHVHFRQPGLTHKADIYTESRAAVAGGVTSFMDMPNTNPATTTLEALEQKMQIAASDSLANYSFFIGATNSNIDVLRSVDYSRVPGIKLFMGSSTGGMLVDGSDALDQIFSIPVLIATHCEDEAIIRANVQRARQEYAGTSVPVEKHCEIRSNEACVASTRRAIDYARRHNTRLHILHVTTAEELRMITDAPATITAEACVAHLRFTSDDYKSLGTRIKCNPAVKEAHHRAALRKAVCDDVITTISTDHAPHTLQEKAGDALTAPSGMPMIQYSLPAMLDLALSGEWPIEKVVEKMCHAQADTFGIEGRGYIRPGYYADLVEVALDEVTTVTDATTLSKCAWSPLAGTTLRSRVKRTWVNGTDVFTDTLEQASHSDTTFPTSTSTTPARPLKFNPRT